jgi:NitT/TauT family transport system substrate-binding protein
MATNPTLLSRSRWITTCAAAAASVRPERLRAQPAAIRVGGLTSDTFAMPYYAQELGFFTRAGLNVEVIQFNNGAAQAAAAAGGSLDVGVGEATELANGAMRGLPFAIIAGGSMFLSNAPTTLLVVAKNSSIRTPREFEGQTIAVPALVALTATAVRAWIAQNGGDLSKVRFVELPLPQMAEAIARGTIAGAHLGEPQLTAGSALLQPIATPYDAIAKQFIISDWFTTRDWIARNPDTAKRFVAVAYETARWANANRDASLAILAKYAKYDLDLVRNMRRASYATALDPRLIQPVLDAGTKYKALERAFNANDLIVRF